MTRKRISSTPEILKIDQDLLMPVVDTSKQPDNSGGHIRATTFAVEMARMVATVITDSMDTTVAAASAAYNYSVETSGFMNSAETYATSAEYWANVAYYNYSVEISGYMNIVETYATSAINAVTDSYNYSVETSGYMVDAETYAVSASYWANVALSATLTPYSIVSGTVLLDDTFETVEANGLTEITLPTAVGLIGRKFNIIRTGTENVTIIPDGSETISGETSIVLTSQWDSIIIFSNNTNWVRG